MANEYDKVLRDYQSTLSNLNPGVASPAPAPQAVSQAKAGAPTPMASPAAGAGMPAVSNVNPFSPLTPKSGFTMESDAGTGNAGAGAAAGISAAAATPATPTGSTTPAAAPAGTPASAGATGGGDAGAVGAAGGGMTTPGFYMDKTTPSLYDQIMALYGQYGGTQLPENIDLRPEIEAMYKAQLEAQLSQLQTGYDKVLAQLEAAGQKIPGLYHDQSTALSADYERQRQNMNEQMAASGLNVGAGSQAQLAQNAGYMSGAAQIRRGQADAQAELERQRVEAEMDYQSAVRQALADGDYQKAMAIMQERQDFMQRAMQLASMQIGMDQDKIGTLAGALESDQQAALEQARIRAGYGDFSGFAQLYGEDAAKQMQQIWMAQNPGFALMTGAITPEQYAQLTGSYPSGYGGGYGGGYGAAGTAGASGGTGSQNQSYLDLVSRLEGVSDAATFDSLIDQIDPEVFRGMSQQQLADLQALREAIVKEGRTTK